MAVKRFSWCLQTAASLQTHEEEEAEQDGDAHEEDAGGPSQGDMSQFEGTRTFNETLFKRRLSVCLRISSFV